MTLKEILLSVALLGSSVIGTAGVTNYVGYQEKIRELNGERDTFCDCDNKLHYILYGIGANIAGDQK
jgi:hypothetical protein